MIRHTLVNTAYTLETYAITIRDIAPFAGDVVYAENLIHNGMPDKNGNVFS